MANGLTTIGEQSLSVRNATELIPAIEKYGAMIAKGGLFGCKNTEQGQTLVLMSMSEGIPIPEMRKRYHIINGSDLSMRADWMLAEFERVGGWWDWINQGDDGEEAILHVKYKHHDKKVKYTIGMARTAGLVKPKSGWEKNPGEMLRARCQTKAIRMVCPKVIAGFATDQELTDDVIDGDYTVTSDLDRADSPATVIDSSVAAPADGRDETIEEAVFKPIDPNGERASAQQIKVLMTLFKELDIDSLVQLKAFQSVGSMGMADLEPAGADKLIEKLRPLVKQPKATGITDEAPVVSEQATGITYACTPEQAERLKALIQSLAQAENGVAAVQEIKAHMDKSGLAKFTDLHAAEADELIGAIESRNLRGIFSKPFVGAAKKD